MNDVKKLFPKKFFLGIQEGTCNLNCPKCYVFGDENNKQRVPKGILSLSQVEEILKQLKNKNVSINPTTWSEFLLPKNAKEYLELINQYEIPMSVNSNGFLITKDIANFLVNLPFQSINISIDAFTSDTLLKTRGTDKIEELKNIVHLLLEARGENSLPRIGVSFTHEQVNDHEKKRFLDYWIQYVDVIRVNSVIDMDLKKSWTTTKPLPKRIPCPSLYDEMLINCNGDVPICCHDSMCDYNMGNVFDAGIENIYNGEKFNKIRSYHENGQFDKIDICKNCTAWSENIFYEIEETNDLLIKRSYTTEFYNKKDRLHTLSSSFGDRGIQKD